MKILRSSKLVSRKLKAELIAVVWDETSKTATELLTTTLPSREKVLVVSELVKEDPNDITNTCPEDAKYYFFFFEKNLNPCYSQWKEDEDINIVWTSFYLKRLFWN